MIRNAQPFTITSGDNEAICCRLIGMTAITRSSNFPNGMTLIANVVKRIKNSMFRIRPNRKVMFPPSRRSRPSVSPNACGQYCGAIFVAVKGVAPVMESIS